MYYFCSHEHSCFAPLSSFIHRIVKNAGTHFESKKTIIQKMNMFAKDENDLVFNGAI